MNKRNTLFVLLFIFISCISCKREAPEPHSLKIIGSWNSYEWNTAEGEIIEHPANIFGTFYSGVTFNDSYTFTMFMDFEDDAEHEAWLKGEQPTWEIQENSLLKLQFPPPLDDMEGFDAYMIEKLTDNELWLRYASNKQQYIKFQRQP